MSDQHKVGQAESSLDALEHAVDQAESHPSEHKIEEADNSFRRAEIAVRQAMDAGGEGADRLARQLRQERKDLRGEQS